MHTFLFSKTCETKIKKPCEIKSNYSQYLYSNSLINERNEIKLQILKVFIQPVMNWQWQKDTEIHSCSRWWPKYRITRWPQELEVMFQVIASQIYSRKKYFYYYFSKKMWWGLQLFNESNRIAISEKNPSHIYVAYTVLVDRTLHTTHHILTFLDLLHFSSFDIILMLSTSILVWWLKSPKILRNVKEIHPYA